MIPVMPFQNSANIRVPWCPGVEIKPVKQEVRRTQRNAEKNYPPEAEIPFCGDGNNYLPQGQDTRRFFLEVILGGTGFKLDINRENCVWKEAAGSMRFMATSGACVEFLSADYPQIRWRQSCVHK
jgi:hypothetical protein